MPIIFYMIVISIIRNSLCYTLNYPNRLRLANFNRFCTAITYEKETNMRKLAETISKLNKAQREAVLADPTGASRCIAGPGSGKTKVLTHRVLYLIGVVAEPPESILALTFTNKAGEEMKNRLRELLGEANIDSLAVGTFHSICARLLRFYGSRYLPLMVDNYAVDNSFTIYDDDDSVRIVKILLTKAGFSLDFYKPTEILESILNLKEFLISGDVTILSKIKAINKNIVRDLLPLYNAELYNSNALDFNDLLILTWKLLRDFPDARNKIRNRFRHILVDEYQDTNKPQYEIVRYLASLATEDPTIAATTTTTRTATTLNRSLFIVGDMNQAIYSWRGAIPENIDLLKVSFPLIKTFNLLENYRCSPPITEVANALLGRIVTKSLRKGVDGSTSKSSFPPVQVIHTFNEYSEAQYIANDIRNNPQQNNIAILYRTNFQSRTIEAALVKAGIPYRLFGGRRFYDRREVKIIICYLRLLANPKDTAALNYIINTPKRGIGEATVESLFAWVNSSKLLAVNAKKVPSLVDHLLSLIVTDNSSIDSTRKDKLHAKSKKISKKKKNSSDIIMTTEVINNNNTSNDHQGGGGGGELLEEDTTSMANKYYDYAIASCPLTTREKNLLSTFAILIQKLLYFADSETLPNLIKLISDEIALTEYLAQLSKNEIEVADRLNNIDELRRSAARFMEGGPALPSGQLVKFLQEVTLLSGAEASSVDDDDEDVEAVKMNALANRVSLMTIHSAKGMEFNSVYITGFEEGLLPHANACPDDDNSNRNNNGDQHQIVKVEGRLVPHNAGDTTSSSTPEFSKEIEEERRLAFVAITRAKTHLKILWRKEVTVLNFSKNSKMRKMKRKISRFLPPLHELPLSTCEFINNCN